MAYVKVATSYRHGGLNGGAGSSGLDAYPVILTYGEEDSLTWGFGWKSTFGGGLIFNVAGFFTVYQEFLNTTNNGCPGRCTLLDIDDSTPLGFDADGSRILFDADGNMGEELPTAWFIDNIGEAEAWGFDAEFAWRKIFDSGALLHLRAGWARVSAAATRALRGGHLSRRRDPAGHRQPDDRERRRALPAAAGHGPRLPG